MERSQRYRTHIVYGKRVASEASLVDTSARRAPEAWVAIVLASVVASTASAQQARPLPLQQLLLAPMLGQSVALRLWADGLTATRTLLQPATMMAAIIIMTIP